MGKVVIVTCVFPPEPVVSANLSYDIAQSVHKIGKDVIVLSPHPSRPHSFAFIKEKVQMPFEHFILDSYVCPQSRLLGRFRESFSFGKATYNYIQINNNDIDVIYANTWPLFAQFFLAKAAKKYKIPYFIHVQDIYPESYCHKIPKPLGGLLYRVLSPIDKFVLRNAKVVFAISPLMKSYLAKSRGVIESKIQLVRNWQDDEAFIEAYRPLDDTHDSVRLMFLGSINPTANVSLIIRAFTHLNKEQFELSIIGDGSEKKSCQILSEQLGVKISFDSVNPDTVANKQSEADILILCLKKGVAQTATPSKLTAYMLTGRPIVASVDLDSDCASIIREAGCGVVVGPEDEDALCNAIKELARKSKKELNKLGYAAFDYAKTYLSRERNLSMIIEQLIDR